MARYRLLALAAVAAIAVIGAGAALWFVAGDLSVSTLVALAITAAFILGLAGLGVRGARRTSTPYW